MQDSSKYERPATKHERARVDNTRSQSARAHTLERKALRTAKRFIVGGVK